MFLNSCAEISPLSTLSAEVSPMWPYVLIFSRLMAALRAQTFVSVGVCSQSDIALSLSWSFSARILEVLIVSFIYLCTGNYAIDGDHTRGWSRPYARLYVCTGQTHQNILAQITEFHTDLTNLTDCASLRPRLSALPSVFSRMANASVTMRSSWDSWDLRENQIFARV